MKTSDLRELIQRLASASDHDGMVRLDQFIAGLQEMQQYERDYRTVFDRADEEHGYLMSGFPPPGPWQDWPNVRYTQEAHIDL
jgi:hypothetical protein